MTPEQRRASAWTNVLATQSGKIVVADILARCGHWYPSQDPILQARQQVAIEILRASGLFDEKSGSFPVDYVTALTRLKLQQPEPEPEAPMQRKGVPFSGLLGRLLGRKS